MTSDQAAGRRWDAILDAAQRSEHPDERGERAELCHRFDLQHPVAGTRIVLVTFKRTPTTSIVGFVEAPVMLQAA